MSMSLNLADLLKAVTEHSVFNRQKMADYLNNVAAEADELAKIWASYYADFINNPSQEQFLVEYGTARRFNSALYQVQLPTFARLESFYYNISRVFNGKYKYQEELVQALGSLLRHRTVTKKRFVEAVLQAHTASGEIPALDDLEKVIQSLQEYAATIHVLAKSFH